MSSPRGALSALCSAGIYPSPRYVSPRTPRSIQQPSPRKPEAVPATLTISQHKELDSAIRRVETLEEHLSVTLAENRRLQEALNRALGRGLNGDAESADLDSPSYAKGGAGAELSAEAVHGGDAGADPEELSWARRGAVKGALSFGADSLATASDEKPAAGSESRRSSSTSASHAGRDVAKPACADAATDCADADAERADGATKAGCAEASTQVSHGELGSEADSLLRHWELDWASLEKVRPSTPTQ
jgi:hypothetical protein